MVQSNIIKVMEINNGSEEKSECDNVTSLELQKSKRILYFSDGILEELCESEEDITPDITDTTMNATIEMSDLPLGSRIKYQACQIGSRLLNGVEYVGEGLASFFGITNPKYISESDIEYIKKGEQQAYDLDSLSHSINTTGWHDNNNTSTSNMAMSRCSRNTAITDP